MDKVFIFKRRAKIKERSVATTVEAFPDATLLVRCRSELASFYFLYGDSTVGLFA